MYCTLSELKAYLGIGSEDDDTLLTDLIERAQAMIESYCGRVFETASDSTRVFDAARDVEGRALVLDADLCQITSITNGDGLVVAANEYVTEPRNDAPYRAIVLKSGADTAWTYDDTPENAISITGRWAYSVSAPADITHACIRLAAYLYRQKDNPADGARVTAEGVVLVASRLPPDVVDVLGRYRRIG